MHFLYNKECDAVTSFYICLDMQLKGEFGDKSKTKYIVKMKENFSTLTRPEVSFFVFWSLFNV